ncbi:MAG: hypothetical protein ABIG61_12055 [Planctomycetota bacterium]
MGESQDRAFDEWANRDDLQFDKLYLQEVAELCRDNVPIEGRPCVCDMCKKARRETKKRWAQRESNAKEGAK